MAGIHEKVVPDCRRSLIDRHLPNTSQVQRLLRKEGRAHVFNDFETLQRVTEAIIERGEQTGADDTNDDYKRFGLYFPEAIGYIIRLEGNPTLLYYGEIKVLKSTGEYHVIPRTRPRGAS